MKEVATLTVRQNPDEPRLKMRIYRDKREHFYGCIESDDPALYAYADTNDQFERC